MPLNILPTTYSTFWNDISEFCLDIWGPSDTFLVDVDLLSSFIFVFEIKLESVIKETLCNKTTGNRRLVIGQHDSTHRNLLIVPEIANSDDRVTIWKFFYCQIVSSKLQVLSWFYIPSVVLVELVQLIVNIDRSINRAWLQLANWYLTRYSSLESFITNFIVSNLHLDDLVIHYFNANSDCHKNYSENCKLQHRTCNGGNRSPSRQSLLFEFWLF